MTKCGKIIGVKRPTLTICAMLAAVAFSAGAEPISPLHHAAYEAFRLCARVDPNLWLDECGSMSGRSAAHSAARRALIRMYNERTFFMGACQAADSLGNCQQQAQWHMLHGFTRAVEDADQQTAQAK